MKPPPDSTKVSILNSAFNFSAASSQSSSCGKRYRVCSSRSSFRSGADYMVCAVGRNRISLMSTFSGWLSAKTAARAKLSAGIELLA